MANIRSSLISILFITIYIVFQLCVNHLRIPIYNFTFDIKKIFIDGEIYRLFSSIFVSKSTINRFHRMFFLYDMYKLENRIFPKRKGTFLFIILLAVFFVDLFSIITPNIDQGACLLFSMNIIFHKMVGNAEVLLMLIAMPFQFYDILLIIAIGLEGRSLFLTMIYGYLIGCFIFYILFVLPIVINKPIFSTPKFLQLFDY